ncbi:translation termination factor GTPase eRF3 [Aspergillus saccharolyticus JOP 1030-1]|uniref:Elongation factor 1-alpha n=1 Tax=Aspergillus saccharolyticus JOP 1030-1 TaxID=1450539 RepID=A0A318ZG83_9EURO|nr:hypothetical protein BP01DRAFT_294059 [Aspergillus saccharolyticus JOP 1030-1]PYH46561.1 hypothetical protein BP01DRAFT_294059 [Aspergillus saccharolyticus JOP 1030-1]
MANQTPESWEDELSRQTEGVNLNNNGRRQQQFNYQGSTFTPGAASFTPGAAAFVPGQQAYGGYPQYGQQYGYQQQQPYAQYGGQYGAYAQQPGGYNQYYNQQQQYGGYQQQPQQSQQPQQQPKPAAEPKPAAPKTAKVLSIGAEPKAKVLSVSGASDSPNAPKTKVLSIGSTSASPSPAASGTATPGDVKGSAAADAAAKVTASKAIEKTEKKAEAKAAASGKSSPAPASGRSSPGRSSPSRAEVVKAARHADAVAQEQKADVDEATLNELYGELEKKEHVNVVFIGHVDAGKSTLGGCILVATGMVDERTLDKYKRDAKEAGRETWYLSWALDLNPEERAKGKTVEVGRAHFEITKKSDPSITRNFSILDAPGHKAYVHHMIGGATQADVGVLVISARKGEYETGFEKGGQTREHALLARNTGVRKLVIAVNKMDDPTVEWSQDRYKVCTTKVAKYLEALGYAKTDLTFMPISAQTMVNIKDRVTNDVCPWYDGPSLLEFLSEMELPPRKLNAPFMMAISAKYRDMGTMVEGKIDSGIVKKNHNLVVVPGGAKVEVAALYGETEDEIVTGSCGEQVRMRLRGVEEEDLLPGFVLCSPRRLVHSVHSFEAKIKLLELKGILSAGYNCVMHVHSAVEEVTIAALLHKLEPGTGRRSKKAPAFASKGMTVIARVDVTSTAGYVCCEPFSYSEQMGRFTLRDQGQTIAIGMITKLIENDEVVAE